MGKLEQLRQLVADAFAEATDKKQIEQLASINNSIQEVEKEQQVLEEKNAELIKSYKDLIQHTSFNDKNNQPADQTGTSAPVSFEDALAKFMSEQR